MLARRILRLAQDVILARPGSVVLFCLALTAGAAWLAAGVELRSSRAEMAGPEDPEQAQLDALLDDYANAGDLIVSVEADPATPGGGDGRDAGKGLRAFADRLAAALQATPEIAAVFHRVDTAWFAARAPHLAPPALLEQIAAAAAERGEILNRLAASRSLADLDSGLAALVRENLGTDAAAGDRGNAPGVLAGLVALLDWQARFLVDPAHAVSDLRPAAPLDSLAPAASSYLSTRDRTMLFLLCSPASADDSLPTLNLLMAAARRAAAAVAAQVPGYRVGFTGQPAITVEEMRTVRRDTLFTAFVASAGVALLTLAVFRWRLHAVLVLAALAIGVVWSLGAVWLETGYLNMITSSFLSTLVGIGVAYGIHPVSEYELQGAHLGDATAALRRALHATGPAVTVSGVTTAAAFLSIQLMRFRGFAELGLVAGVGVLLCLVSALLLLPALMVMHGRRRQRGTQGRRPPTSLVDRLWVERGAALVCRAPRTVSIIGLLVTAALGTAAWGVGFDSDIRALLPAGAESLRLQRRLIEDSDLSPASVLVVAPDVAALRRLQETAAMEPAIARFESVLRFLPEPDAGRAATLEQLAARLTAAPLAVTARAATRMQMTASLRSLEAALADAGEAAFGVGLGDLAGPLESARAAAQHAKEVAGAAAPAAEERWRGGWQDLLRWAAAARAALQQALAAPAPGLDDLPPPVRSRFVTRSGRLIAFLHPAGDIFDTGFRARLVAASRRVDASATGFPIVFHHVTERITGGFGASVALGSVLVVLLLLLDYRDLKHTLLAILPLAMGVIWMLGGMRLLGISYNFANLVAVPLIIGVGIDNGVHVIHRLRDEGAQGMPTVLRHTCRAILIASLTTMIGFGSLALASHRGLASLGVVLLLGVGACLITSTVVLPNLLVAFGLAHGGARVVGRR